MYLLPNYFYFIDFETLKVVCKGSHKYAIYFTRYIVNLQLQSMLFWLDI